jgi:HK97 gp10 family phage protein
MPINAQVTGFKEMQDRIARLREVVRDQGAREAARAGATVIRDEMRVAAPVLAIKTTHSSALDPGSLKRAIRMYIRRISRFAATAVIGPAQRVAHVAIWVEYGHRMIKGGYSKIDPDGKVRGPGHEVGEVAPHPFLRPAYETAIAEAIRAANETMREFFREVLG